MDRALVLIPRGGLANRLRAAASGSLLAQACGRAFYLNWEPTADCGAAWSDLFQNPFPAHEMDAGELRAGGLLYEDDDSARLPEGTVRRVLDDARPVIGMATNQMFRPPECGNFAAARGAFYRSLAPVWEVEDAVRRFIEGNDVRAMVGVHIRRGDLLSDKGWNPHSISPIGEFIARCREELASRRPSGFFLATDSPRDERALCRAFGPLVHIRPRIMERDSVAGIRDALIDWLLLAQTQFVIRSYFSSFSKEACAVHGIGSFIVVRERPPVAVFLWEVAHRLRRKVGQIPGWIRMLLRPGRRPRG